MVGESLPAQEKGPFLCGQPHVSRMLRFRVRSYNGKWERQGTSAVDACMPGYKFEGCGLCACALSAQPGDTERIRGRCQEKYRTGNLLTGLPKVAGAKAVARC